MWRPMPKRNPGNVTQGTRYMQAAMRTFRNLSNNPGVGLSPRVARVVKVFRAASTVLTVFGIVLDGLLLVFAAIQGARQREELQRSVNLMLHSDLYSPNAVTHCNSWHEQSDPRIGCSALPSSGH